MISRRNEEKERVGVRSRTPPPASKGTVLHQLRMERPNAEMCRMKKIADTYGSLNFGSSEAAPSRSLYHDQFQGHTSPPPAPIYPKACLYVDRSSKGSFQSVSQSDYSHHSNVQRKTYIGLDKQSGLRSSLPLADSQGAPFLARSEKQDQYLAYNIVYRHT